MSEARGAGYEIDLTFLCLENPTLNELRVAARVALGGHNVPTQDIHRRYARGLRHLPAALTLADSARLVDNSTESAPRLVARFARGRCAWRSHDIPGWAASVVNHL